MSSRSFRLTPDLLLRAYAAGIFPMAESSESDELRWFDPPLRALIPLDERFHVSHSLAKTIKRKPFSVKIDTAFKTVIEGCAEKTPTRPLTWINAEIVELYTRLFHAGRAHSVEIWAGEDLIGGLYGVVLGSAFFGESMFNRVTDASKIALVHLVALLRARGFTLLDTQFQTDHLAHFGTLEVTRSNYHLLLAAALEKQASLFRIGSEQEWETILIPVLKREER